MLHQTPKDLRSTVARALRIRGLLDETSHWSSLEGGRTNQVWRIAHVEGDIVVKLFCNDRRNPLFPNEPTDEVAVLQHLGNDQIAPRVLDYFTTEVGMCLIYHHLDGRPWRSDSACVAALLHRVHLVSPPKGLRKACDGSDALKLQTDAILRECKPARATALRRLEPKNQISPSRFAALLHADPVPANIIDHAGDLKLIDWQCPAIGDPCEDIAVFLSPAMQQTYRGAPLTAEERRTFLDNYPDRETVGRYRRLEPWYLWRMAAYCLWQEARGDTQATAAYLAETERLRIALSEQL